MIKLKSLLIERRSPYPKATTFDKKRGFLGSVDGYGNVDGYIDMLPNVMEVDHSELGISHFDSGRFRFFVAYPENTILWSDYPPQPEQVAAAEKWLGKKGFNVERHIDYKTYSSYPK